MRAAYFDSISGAAGDMVIGALVDAGLDLADLRAQLSRLPLEGYSISAERVYKQGIAATQFLVQIEAPEEHYHGHDHGSQDKGRALVDILSFIDSSGLPAGARDTAGQIFRRLGEAEARIHGVPVEDVHFHEVGAIDSIVDVVGAALGFELLGLDRIFCSALPLGSGTVETRHGTYPIPAPATLEILARAGVPTRPGEAGTEQVTPTGAAILTTVSTFQQPEMRPERIGYGSGESDLAIPNVLRVWIGEVDETDGGASERLAVIETNIDDMNPELYDDVLGRCRAMGALDTTLIPSLMKKGRPGIKLELLCRPADAARLRDLLLRETSTLGVREHFVDRYAAAREICAVATPYGEVQLKVKRFNGTAVAASPEYESCRQVARACEVPLIDVYQAAQAAAQQLLKPEE